MTRALKIATIIGARPQFIKAAPVSHALRARGGVEEMIVHTGQHYDEGMSAVFFSELGVPEPIVNLGVGGLPHGAMTGRLLERIEALLGEWGPDRVLVYGDTNSTLAGALAAAKLGIPVAHVEAGLRSFNRQMPEEVNRVLTDHVADLLLCPSPAAVANLEREGIVAGVHNVGDVMYDVVLNTRERARRAVPLDRWGVRQGDFALATVHRQENTDDPERLSGILQALDHIASEVPVLLPLHPRTRRRLEDRGWSDRLGRLTVTAPLSYLEMHRLMMAARAVLTDSGGVQKEALFHAIPCLTLRDQTEWTETVELGCNRLCGADPARILAHWREIGAMPFDRNARPYGDGHAAQRIAELLGA